VRKFQTEKEEVPSNHCWCQKTKSDWHFVWYQNIRSAFWFCHKAACVRRTDRQNYDSQDRASIAASRGKNTRRAHRQVLISRCDPTGALGK